MSTNSMLPLPTADDLSVGSQAFLQGMDAVNRQDYEAAASYFCQALANKPDSVETLNNLGLVFKTLGQFDKAEACLRKAIDYNPYSLTAYYNLGFVYQKTQNFTDAEFCFRRSLELSPDNPDIWNSLGVLFETAAQLSAAETAYKTAIQIQPTHAIAHYNLGNLFKVQQQLTAAEYHLCHAHQLAPHEHELALGLAFFYLLCGNFPQGWQTYAAALRLGPHEYPDSPMQEWHGDDLTGKTILLYAGEGFGDTLQFIRFLPYIQKLAAQTFLWVQEPLQRLFAAHYDNVILGPEEVAWQQPYDYFCSLQALPIYFAIDEDSLPHSPYYLQALRADLPLWQARINAAVPAGQLRVGIAWSGNIYNPMDSFRSIPFSTFCQLLDVDEVAWISLQVGVRAQHHRGLTDRVYDFTEQLTDFAHTAALISQLDLVITTDTSVVHLAGALGKPTWLLLDTNSDWRWHLNRSDTPWYPAMRLFRQQQTGNWPDVLTEVQTELRQFHCQQAR